MNLCKTKSMETEEVREEHLPSSMLVAVLVALPEG